MNALRRLIASLRFGTPLAVSPAYASLLRQEAQERRKHRAVRHLQARRTELLHSALRGVR